MLPIALLTASLLAQTPPDAPGDWRAQFEAGKQTYVKHDYTEASDKLRSAAEGVARTNGNEPVQLEILRYLAAVHREMGEPAKAEQVLLTAAERSGATGPSSLKLAAILEELSAVQRAQGHGSQALESLETRVKEALLRKAEREGRRPSPVTIPK